jgi:hypothetical protein
VGVSSAANLFQKNQKFSYRRISHISRCLKIQDTTVRKPVVKQEKCGTCRWQKEILLKRKERLQSLPITLDFKLESHREGSATYFREYLHYMKNGLMKTRNPTDLIMTSTKMD